MLTDAQASSRCRASRLRTSSCVGIGEVIDRHDALFGLQRELSLGASRVKQVSSDTFQTCEVSTGCLFRRRDCIPSKRMRCQVGLLPDTLTRYGTLSAHQVPVLRGQVGVLGLAPPRLVCGREALSPSSATASSACRGSVSHVSPESLYVTRFSTVCLTIATRTQSGFLHQLELLVQFLTQPIEVITTSSDDKIVTVHDHVKNLGMSVQTHMDNCLSKAGQCLHHLSEQGVAILLLQGACRTYVSSATSIVPCRAGVAVEVSRMSRSVRQRVRMLVCRRVPWVVVVHQSFDSVAALFITQRTSANGGVPAK